jgi:hypothetical protein
MGQQSPGRRLKFVDGQPTGPATEQMFGEAPCLNGIQGTKHPPRGIPAGTVRAVVMAGIEALLAHRALLAASPSDYYDDSVAYGSMPHP